MKFRVRGWHTVLKKMFSPEEMAKDQLTLMPDGSGFINVSSVHVSMSQLAGEKMIPLMSTGLFDRFGKEIFDGDLLKCYEEDDHGFLDGVVYKVSWQGEHYPAFDIDGFDGESNGLSHYNACGKMEIVGNIYEHPHMIE